MDQNKAVKGILDSLMKTEKLKRFVTEHDDEGNTYVKMKFVPNLGDNGKSSESSNIEKKTENLNSDVHMYRKSDARFTRDITRTKGPKLRNSCVSNQNESASNQSVVIGNQVELEKDNSSAPSEQTTKFNASIPSSVETPVEISVASKPSCAETPAETSGSVKSSVKPSGGVVTRSSGKSSNTKTSTVAVNPVGGAVDCLPYVAPVNTVTQKPEWIVHAYDSHMTVSKAEMNSYFCDECNLTAKDAVSQGIKIAFCNTRGCVLGCSKDTIDYCICEKCFNDSSHNNMRTPCYVTILNFPYKT